MNTRAFTRKVTGDVKEGEGCQSFDVKLEGSADGGQSNTHSHIQHVFNTRFRPEQSSSTSFMICF